MEQGMKKRTGLGIPLGAVNGAMIVIAVIAYAFLLYAAAHSIEGCRQVQRATDEYIAEEQNASDMQVASDYLTWQVRSFTVTGEKKYADGYFEEAEVTRRRDRAVERIQRVSQDDASYLALNEALQYSNELMEMEYYAMRLCIDAWGYEIADYPAVLAQVEISPEDQALDAQNKLERARMLVFGEEYQAYKDQIGGAINQCLDNLILATREKQVQSSDELLRLLENQRVLVCVLLLVTLAVVLLTLFLVIRPLRQNVIHVKMGQPMPVKGSSEMQFLARTYNDIFERKNEEQDKLSYEVTHDSLTGIYNRKAYESILNGGADEDQALLWIDVDHFKTINDTYGHAVGDQVLKKVASVLLSSFRSEDYVFRVGGDEFAVLMVHANSELKELISEKVRRINDQLQHPLDDLPPVSLSVGVAFNDQEKSADLLCKHADIALYRVKNSCRGQCRFY